MNAAGGRFYFANSLIAGNRIVDCVGDVTTLRGNLVGDPGVKTGSMLPCNISDWASLPGHRASDRIGRVNLSGPYSVVDIFKNRSDGTTVHPLLANNGGDTCTVSLCIGQYPTNGCQSRSTSWAANAGWSSTSSGLACSATDQRSAVRTDTCDTGAFEIGPLAPFFLTDLKCSGREDLQLQ
jgi:hypothetical protein